MLRFKLYLENGDALSHWKEARQNVMVPTSILIDKFRQKYLVKTQGINLDLDGTAEIYYHRKDDSLWGKVTAKVIDIHRGYSIVDRGIQILMARNRATIATYQEALQICEEPELKREDIYLIRVNIPTLKDN